MSSTCRVPGCSNSQFTFCPHCSLRVCIKCLNEHYSFMKNDYKEYLHNFQTELNINRQQNWDEQYQISKRLSELIQYDQFTSFLADKIDQDGKLSIKTFQPSDYLELKTNFTQLVENHQKFNQLIQQINHLIADFERTNNSSKPNADNYFPMPKSDSVLPIEPDDDDDDDDELSNSNGDLKSFIEYHMSHPSRPPNHQSMQQKTKDLYTSKELKQMMFPCPLIKYTFGLQQHHCHENGITNIPCESSEDKTFCLFTHLHHHHVLNTPSALKIIRTLICLPNHLERIDLFSKESIDSLMGNMILSYTGLCPLVKYGIYGILPAHQIKLCNRDRRKKIIVHYHMRATHQIAHYYASRLVRAMLNNIDETTPIIRADEDIRLLRKRSAE